MTMSAERVCMIIPHTAPCDASSSSHPVGNSREKHQLEYNTDREQKIIVAIEKVIFLHLNSMIKYFRRVPCMSSVMGSIK